MTTDEIHERAIAVLTRIKHDMLLRQGDPVMTLSTFLETEINNALERGARSRAEYIVSKTECPCSSVDNLMQLWREGRGGNDK